MGCPSTRFWPRMRRFASTRARTSGSYASRRRSPAAPRGRLSEALTSFRAHFYKGAREKGCMAEKMTMPQSTAGLIRYTDEVAGGIKVSPQHVVMVSVAILLVEIVAKTIF